MAFQPLPERGHGWRLRMPCEAAPSPPHAAQARSRLPPIQRRGFQPIEDRFYLAYRVGSAVVYLIRSIEKLDVTS